MSLVQILFEFAVGLILLSTVVILVLISTRVLSGYLSKSDQELRLIARRAFVSAMLGSPDLAERFRPLLRRPVPFAEALLEFSEVIRGADRDQMLVALLHEGAVKLLERGALKFRRSRLVCVEAIGIFPRPAAEPALCRLLHHRDVTVKFAAALGLLDMGAALPFSLAGLVTTRSRKHVGLANTLLRRIVKLDPAIGRMALESPDLDLSMRALVIDALGISGDFGAVPALLNSADHPSPAIRASTILALGRLIDPRGAGVIARGLSDRHWIVRAAAAQAVGIGNFLALAPQLDALFTDPVWSVRFQAVEALKSFGPSGLERLLKLERESSDREISELTGGALYEAAAA